MYLILIQKISYTFPNKKLINLRNLPRNLNKNKNNFFIIIIKIYLFTKIFIVIQNGYDFGLILKSIWINFSITYYNYNE